MTVIARLCKATLILVGLLVVVLAGFRVAAFFNESAAPEALAPKTGRFVLADGLKIYLQEKGPTDGRVLL